MTIVKLKFLYKPFVRGIASLPAVARNDNQRGISLIEVIAAIMIIAMGMIGVLSLVIQNVQAQYINKNVLVASGLAQEGLELVRNIRDNNWLTPGNAWNQSLGSGSYTIEKGATDSPRPIISSAADINSARLYFDADNFYTYSATASPTNFYRLITITEQPDYLDVLCLIRWKDGTKTHDYTAETYLYNWR